MIGFVLPESEEVVGFHKPLLNGSIDSFWPLGDWVRIGFVLDKPVHSSWLFVLSFIIAGNCVIPGSDPESRILKLK